MISPPAPHQQIKEADIPRRHDSIVRLPVLPGCDLNHTTRKQIDTKQKKVRIHLFELCNLQSITLDPCSRGPCWVSVRNGSPVVYGEESRWVSHRDSACIGRSDHVTSSPVRDAFSFTSHPMLPVKIFRALVLKTGWRR